MMSHGRSYAYQHWIGDRKERLDEIEASHAALGGTERGRRFATLQINQTYAVMLSSQFQGFCRDLHDECADHLVVSLSPQMLQTAIERLLVQGRKLDVGNPNPGNLGSDFNRFGVAFWPEVQQRDNKGQLWKERLEELTDWRNAIAHQSFDPQKLHGISTLTLKHVKQWRSACNGLARTFDSVMCDFIHSVTNNRPW